MDPQVPITESTPAPYNPERAVSEVEPGVEGPKPNRFPAVLLFLLSLLLLLSTGYLAFQNFQLQKQINSLQATPSPSSTPDVTANWELYTDSKLGFSIKYPSGWSIEKNILYPYGKPDNSEAITTKVLLGAGGHGWSGTVETKSFPAGIASYSWVDSTNIISAFASFKKNNQTYIIEVRSLPSEKGPGFKSIFDQILSTFKFPEDAATPEPISNAKKLNYNLPSGWKTVQDTTGTFEVGYNPETEKIFTSPSGESSVGDLRVGLVNTGPYNFSSYSVSIRPYSGGSRHAFILNGNTLTPQDKMPGYHEQNYTYNGLSCFVLYGISLSQWPSTEGMCAIDGKRAFAFGLWYDEVGTEKIISTIKLLK